MKQAFYTRHNAVELGRNIHLTFGEVISNKRKCNGDPRNLSLEIEEFKSTFVDNSQKSTTKAK